MFAFLFVFSLFLYLIAPSDMNIAFVFANTIIFIIDAAIVLKNDSRRINKMNFNLLFLLSFFLCTYFLPLLVIPAEGLYSVKLVFDYLTMNKCVALSTIGITSYSLVYIVTFKRKWTKHGITDVSSKQVFSMAKHIKPLFNIMFLLVLIILIRFLRSSHEVEIEVDGPPFVFVFFIVAVSLTLILSAYKFDFKKESKFLYLRKNISLLLKLLLICFLYVLIGDRLVIIQLASILIVFYSIYVTELKTKSILLLGMLGFVFMVFISLTRTSDASLKSGNISASMSAASSTMENYYQGNLMATFSDLSERFLELCVGYDYVQKHGIQYPLKIIPILFSPVPLVPNMMTQIIYGVPMAETASGYAVANDTGTNAGSHCVLSVYMHWGLLGVIVGFAVYGFVIAIVSAGYNRSVYYSVSYLILVSMAIFTPRGNLFDIYRPIVWGMLLIYFLSHLKSKKV